MTKMTGAPDAAQVLARWKPFVGLELVAGGVLSMFLGRAARNVPADAVTPRPPEGAHVEAGE